jgi:ketosteroid isomerase-like protein
MSADRKADIVRTAFEGFQRLDLDAFTAAWHEDVLWDLNGYENWPGEKTQYRGEAEVVAGFAGYLSSARSLEVSDLDVITLDDGRVLSTHHERRFDKGSDEPTHLDIGTVYEFGADDRIVRVDVYTGHQQASRAAGLA